MHLSLSPEQLEQVFPFHFAVDRGGELVQIGRGLRALLPALRTGAALVDAFTVIRPPLAAPTVEAMLAAADTLFLLQARDRDIKLRGQVLAAGDGLMFVGTPWLTELGQVGALGLRLSDFAIHDPVSDLLMAMKTVQTSLADARKLADKLGKRTAQLQEAIGRAEEASAAKSAFVANMSHELRTPLNAILGYGEMLLEDAEAAGNLVAVADLRRIELAGKHLLSLIANVLDVARIEARKIDLSLGPCSLRDVVAAVRASIDPLVAEASTLEVPEVPDITLVTDADKLRQILINVLGNACKFTPAGTIRLDVRVLADDTLELAIRDTGIGIGVEQQERLFEAFYQVDSTPRRRHDGAGLGLAISRAYCEALGGRILVDSAPGRGSCFTIRLPLRPR